MNILDELELIEDINKALSYIENKKVLVSIIDNNKTYFMKKNNKLFVLNGNSSFFLNIEQFLDLYKNVKFYVYEDNESTVDYQKDEEYYSWKHKW